MSSNPTPTVPRKLLGAVLVALMSSLFGAFGVMYYLGTFTEVTVQRATAPSYRIAYLEHVGAYTEIEPTFDKVAATLEAAGIEAETACALLLDDTGRTPEERRRAKIGYLVPRNAVVPDTLEVEVFPAREVITATFSGGTVLGSYKVYEAMRDWAKRNRYELLLPALEIHHPGGDTEYQLGIRKRDHP